MRNITIDKVSGIYKIVNKVNGKYYIGSSRNVNKRISEHLSELSNKKHCNKKLQNAYNKYGEEIFKFEIISKCPIQYLLRLEYWFIKTLNPFYNIIKVQEDYKIKFSAKHETKLRNSINPRGSLAVIVFDINNNFIAEFVNISRCAEFLNTPISGISKCLKAGRVLNNKYFFKYKNRNNINYQDKRLIKTNLFTKDGKFLGLFYTYEKLAKYLNVSKDTISRTINNKSTFLSDKYLIFKEN